MPLPRDHLRTLLDELLASLDDDADGAELARRASFSRFHFDRVVAAAVGETPTAFRRRLLLERAAWRLAVEQVRVTDAAFDAGYTAPEAFTRAFVRAFDATPTAWRAAGSSAPATAARGGGDAPRPPSFHLDAPNGIHFHPPAGLLLRPETHPGRTTMDLTDRLLDHDRFVTEQLLAAAATLDAAALDEPIRPGNVVLPFDGTEASVRAMLDRLVFTKQVWLAAIAGEPFPADRDTTLEGLQRRWEAAGPAFVDRFRRVRDDGDWDAAFVDALCEPPESFTFGGVLGHVLTFSAHRREVLAACLTELGASGVPATDPHTWERHR